MAISQIDPSAALVIIDMQKGVVRMPTAHPVGDITARIDELAKAFRSHGLPVVMVNVAGAAPGRIDAKFAFNPPADFAELVPELQPQPGDYTTTKQNIGAFYGTSLERILRRRQVTQLVLVGIATSSGIEATARAAYDHGFNVVTVVDAMTDMNPEAHQYSVEKTFPRISETAATRDVLDRLGAQLKPDLSATSSGPRAGSHGA